MRVSIFIVLVCVSCVLRAQTPPAEAERQLAACKEAKDPAAAYRAVDAGLAATTNVALRARLIACRAETLRAEGKDRETERELATVLALARQAKDVALEADTLANIGQLQYHRGAMADALTNLQRAYHLQRLVKNEKGRLDALSDIANVYADANVGQYDRAIEYYRQLIDGYAKHGQPSDVGDTFFNIGGTLEAKGDFAAAEFHYRRALAIFQKLQRPEDIALTERALGASLMKQGRAAEALPYFEDAVAFFEREGDVPNAAWMKQFRGMAYRRLGRAAPALADLAAARAYFEKEKNTRFLERNAEEVALVYEQLGDWRNAYHARKRHGALQQQLAASRRDELSSRLRVEFDVEKKEQENRALARENALRATALHEAQRNQQLQRAVIALTALLAVALAALFWRQVANTRRVRAMAMTDELTRLPNRRHILAAADMAFATAKREGRSVAVIVFDIDRFKRINDTYGHAAGDTVLKSVAHTCRLALRPSDRIGRTGGEEFLVVLDAVTNEQATEVAERLRAAVERLDFSAIDRDLVVTISLGVWVTNDHDAHAAIAAADSLLYRAKESGRNRVAMAVAS